MPQEICDKEGIIILAKSVGFDPEVFAKDEGMNTDILFSYASNYLDGYSAGLMKNHYEGANTTVKII